MGLRGKFESLKAFGEGLNMGLSKLYDFVRRLQFGKDAE